MSDAMVKVPNFEESGALARTLVKSSLVPDALKGKEADLLFVIMTGAEMGIGPMTALRAFRCIKGQVGMTPEFMVAHVRAHASVEYITCKEATPKRAVWVSKLKGQPELPPTVFTWEDAVTAKLTNSENYQKYPSRMLQWRAAAFHCKAHHSDIIGGLYTPEELTDGREEKDVTPAESGAAAVEAVKAKVRKARLLEVPVEAAPVLPAGDDVQTVGWGKHAARPLADLKDEELAWYLSPEGEAACRKQAPESAERLLTEYRAEASRRVEAGQGVANG